MPPNHALQRTEAGGTSLLHSELTLPASVAELGGVNAPVHVNPLFIAFLRFLGLYLVAVLFLAGIHFSLAATIAMRLRHRQPTIEARRAYLLRGLDRLLPRLSETQRLERVRHGRWLVGALTFGSPAMFLCWLLCRWFGAMSSDVLAIKIELAGLCVGLPLVLFAAYAAARARLASDVLDDRLSSSARPA